MVADEDGLFGEYIAYQTWLPRPVAGTQGLIATPWHRTHERWGAVQMQNHFRELAKRWMNAEDYASWLAVRTIGEAATRKQSADFKILRDYIFSDAFSLAGYKGVKLTFRHWNGQLRQPILLASPRSLVDTMPLREVLHPRTYLDTLGYDEPQSSCRF
jgi:ABC transporter substrate binding protein (PQQ-dependent alcohol dehydrogenase system)